MAIRLALENSNAPLWLPDPYIVVSKCLQRKQTYGGFVEYSPDETDAAWIKYGPLIGMGEARTQDFIANNVNSDKDSAVRVPLVYYAFRHNRVGYIVMQYIQGQDCTKEDLGEVSLAVKRLRSIDSPTTSPGPVGGGPVSHRLFSEYRSAIQYKSVGELQEHVNNILTLARYGCSVDFITEDDGKLSLCLDDIHPGNFRKNTSGQLFALDFGNTNFLPSAFQDFSFSESHAFALHVSESIGWSKSKHRWPLRLAAARQHMVDENSHGLTRSLRQSIGSWESLFE